MEIVCSPVFSAVDARSLYSALYQPRRWRKMSIREVFAKPSQMRWADVLGWAVANQRIEFQVAVRSPKQDVGIFHEKFGVIERSGVTSIAFEGSANETGPGYERNYERIHVFKAEGSDPERHSFQALRAEFERLWAGNTPGLRILSLHDTFQEDLIILNERQQTPDGENPAARLPKAPPEVLRWPPRTRLRDYQEQAVARWFEAQGQGIYAMATGTGKTITSLATVKRLYDSVGGPLIVIIVAPYLHLVDQWLGVARSFGLDPVRCAGRSDAWVPAVDAGIYLANTSRRDLFSVVTTNATFGGKPFQAMLERIRVRAILIADEVHNLGARHLRQALPERVTLRLGLSATPERWNDEEGTAYLESYFGPPVFRFGLKEALLAEPPILTPYTYHPIVVHFDEEESAEYLRLTALLARYTSGVEVGSLGGPALAILLKRARLVGSAKAKMPALLEAITPYKDSYFNLVYCGDGRTELEAIPGMKLSREDDAPLLRQIDTVTRLLGHELNMKVAQYTAVTSAKERSRLQKDFSEGHLQALVAIRCLDEGVDIPGIRRAFILASSTNPRQFVQRRGRVLRQAEGKDAAEIYDFLVAPPDSDLDADSRELRLMRGLMERELRRVVEFARLARNGPQALFELRPFLNRYRLYHLLGESSEEE